MNFSLAEGEVNPAVAATGTADATREKVAWIREAAGERLTDIELNVTVFVCMVTDDREAMAERIAGGFGLSPDEVKATPHVLIGTVDQIAEDLEQRRDEFGFSYVVLSGDVFEAMAPVVKRLAGT